MVNKYIKIYFINYTKWKLKQMSFFAPITLAKLKRQYYLMFIRFCTATFQYASKVFHPILLLFGISLGKMIRETHVYALDFSSQSRSDILKHLETSNDNIIL